jgi:hypothetical protein
VAQVRAKKGVWRFAAAVALAPLRGLAPDGAVHALVRGVVAGAAAAGDMLPSRRPTLAQPCCPARRMDMAVGVVLKRGKGVPRLAVFTCTGGARSCRRRR